MSGSQVKMGKAFEYACLASFAERLKQKGVEVVIVHNSSYDLARGCFEQMSGDEQANLAAASLSAFGIISRLEPYIENSNGAVPLEMALQADARGQLGDVRDILFMRKGADWSIGISMKHNHEAVKHPRLSRKLDFGKQWFGIPCSSLYFAEILPIFDNLKILSSKKVPWSQVEKKEDMVYLPLLQSFTKELLRIAKTNPEVPKLLLEYFLGKYDFYKIISQSGTKTTQVQAFAMHGTLNMPSGTHRPEVRLPKLHMPTQFYSVAMKPGSNTTLEVVCDNGWQISLRIHSARTIVEPSLKFDINLVGHPSIYTNNEPWGSMS